MEQLKQPITMQNELLEALKEAKKGNQTPFLKWSAEKNVPQQLSDLENLLEQAKFEAYHKGYKEGKEDSKNLF